MKLKLLQRLNNYEVVLFKKYFIDYFNEYTNDKQISNKYYNGFIKILKMKTLVIMSNKIMKHYLKIYLYYLFNE